MISLTFMQYDLFFIKFGLNILICETYPRLIRIILNNFLADSNDQRITSKQNWLNWPKYGNLRIPPPTIPSSVTENGQNGNFLPKNIWEQKFTFRKFPVLLSTFLNSIEYYYPSIVRNLGSI